MLPHTLLYQDIEEPNWRHYTAISPYFYPFPVSLPLFSHSHLIFLILGGDFATLGPPPLNTPRVTSYILWFIELTNTSRGLPIGSAPMGKTLYPLLIFRLDYLCIFPSSLVLFNFQELQGISWLLNNWWFLNLSRASMRCTDCAFDLFKSRVCISMIPVFVINLRK